MTIGRLSVKYKKVTRVRFYDSHWVRAIMDLALGE